MNTNDRHHSEVKVSFPWMAYIHQPIGHHQITFILNPLRFARAYRVTKLNIAWQKADADSEFSGILG
jgi:hypothetical protein